MSAGNSCDCNCATPEVFDIPGTAGATGAAGADGTDGANAFTTTTAAITLPGAAGPVVAISSFVDTSWMGVGQIIFISDGTDFAHLKVLTIPSSVSATLEWMDYEGDAAGGSVLGNGSTVSPSGTQPSIPSPTTVANGGTNSATATLARAALGVGGASLTVYAAGTAYQLTNTSALLNFGTTDPSLTITSAGVWLILARARIDYTGSTFAAVRTGTLKLRRTNNTAADLANSSASFLTDIITTLTYTLGVIDLQPVIYTTTNNNDVIELWGDISVVPSAGSLDASEASIVAVKLYDQTV